jgi:DNA replicative helicase MCM subunit Mcm2 (Cdc46/Mcm family)
MAEVVLCALDVLKNGREGYGAPPARKDPKDVVLRFIAAPRDPPAVPLDEILAHGRAQGFSEREVRAALEALLGEGECYMPRNGLIKMA